MELDEQNNCLNCNQPLLTPFCGACGQKKAERISLRVLLKIAQRGIVEFKSPLLVTLWGLTIHPGKVYREYLDGRRATYFNPIRYSFWIITFGIIVSSLMGVSITDFSQVTPELKSPEDKKFNDIFYRFFESSYLYFYFFFAAFHATTMRVLFKQEKYKFCELYIACLLSSSHFSLMYTLLIILGLYGSAASLYALTICTVIYSSWALAELYQPRKIMAYVKATLSYFIAMLVCVFVLAFALGVYSVVQEDSQEQKAPHEKNVNLENTNTN